MQGNMTPQTVNNHTMEDLEDNEEDESSVAEVRRMITRMFKELKWTNQNNSINPKRTRIKNLRDTEKS
jgi:hypothetical protein